jgi:hypothetical protein
MTVTNLLRSKLLFVHWVNYVEFAIGLDTAGKDLIDGVINE